jgi:hypothetical protein
VLKNSTVGRTRQSWKLVVAVLALVIGSIVPAIPGANMSWTVGTILAVVGYAFGVMMIRCPGCGARWFWDALMRAELYKAVLTQPVCPECKRDFSALERGR